MSGDLDATRLDAAGAAARVADAAAERRRLRASQVRDAGQTSMREVLVGAAERSAVVSLILASGRSHRIRVIGVGDDVVVGSTDTDREWLVGLAAVRSVVLHRSVNVHHSAASASGPGTAYDDGTSRNEFDMADILSGRLASRPGISAWCGGEQLTGTLVAVGRDVAAIMTDGGGEMAYVRLDSTTEISLSVPSSV